MTSQQPSARLSTVLAPVGGMNTVDPLSALQPTESPGIYNMYPYLGGLVNRPIFNLAGDTISGYVSTEAMSLMEWVNVSGSGATSKVLLGTDSNIYTLGTPCTSVQSGLNDGHYRWVNMSGIIGMVNESASDGPMTYDGSTVSAMTMSGTAPYTVNQMSGVIVHKARSWFWAFQTSDLYYSAIDTLGGVLTRFPLSTLNHTGGYIVDVISWTRDGGSGMDDYFVIIFNTGAVMIYQGTDPASASTWSLVGIYRIPLPAERNAAFKFGSEVVVMTENGHILLSAALSGADSAATQASLTYKINNIVAFRMNRNTGRDEGWKGVIWGKLLVTTSGLSGYLLVMDIATNAWFLWDVISSTNTLAVSDILVNEGVLYVVGYDSQSSAVEVHYFSNLLSVDGSGNWTVTDRGYFYIPWSFFEAPGVVKRVTAVKTYHGGGAANLTGYVEMISDYDYSPEGLTAATIENARFLSRAGYGNPISLYFANTYITSGVPVYSFDILYEMGGFL